ncbi:MAG: hypothetical protein E7299_08755 [Lachnospiraceae bacterium]|nr:hypothetical protein [Lachnospiraceae bacterium]
MFFPSFPPAHCYINTKV